MIKLNVRNKGTDYLYNITCCYCGRYNRQYKEISDLKNVTGLWGPAKTKRT